MPADSLIMRSSRAILFAVLAGVASGLLPPAGWAATSFEDIFTSRPKLESPVPEEQLIPSKYRRPAEKRRQNGPESRHREYRETGTIEVHTKERTLYLFTKNGQTIRYKVGVGRAGQQWFGSTKIASKHIKPAWTPPDVIRGNKPAWVAEPGSANNPMGAAALVLADHELAIHGTNDPKSIGGYVSWGCIRMYNRDIMDLYGRVSVGTPVVIKH